MQTTVTITAVQTGKGKLSQIPVLEKESLIKLTMHVLEFSPMNESLRTCVSLLALNGV